ncbi:MAG: hypothetical protein ACAH88_18475 [Roseimicrobium sp.]
MATEWPNEPPQHKRRWGILPDRGDNALTPTETRGLGKYHWQKWNWIVYEHDGSTMEFTFSHRTITLKFDAHPSESVGTDLVSATLLENDRVLGTATFQRVKREHWYSEMWRGYRFRTQLHLHTDNKVQDQDSGPPAVDMTFARHKVEECLIDGESMPITQKWRSTIESYSCAAFEELIGRGACELAVKRPEYLVHAVFLGGLLWRHSESERASD